MYQGLVDLGKFMLFAGIVVPLCVAAYSYQITLRKT